jgi:hypothetical protein
VRRGGFLSTAVSVVGWSRSSSRRVWWTSFLLVTLLIELWGLANPPFAGPDEPAHIIRAVALDHGQLTGKKLTPRIEKTIPRGGRHDYLVVRAPKIYRSASMTTCFAYRQDVTAACLRFKGPSRDADVVTYVARHPPPYYAFVGVVSWVYPPGSGAVYLMRFLDALLTGAFIATAITALRRFAAPTVVATGLVLAVTPMVLFMSSVVNPSAPEIAAAIALWVCGLALVSAAQTRVDKRLVTCVGIAGCVLALSRQLAPLWLALMALTMLGVANRVALRNLARSSWARLWALLITASSLAQVGWDVIVKPLEVTRGGRPPVHIGMSEIVRVTLGATFIRYREMVGSFGWLDTPAPALTWVPWTIGIAFLFVVAAAWVNRRQVAVLLSLLAATIAVPVVIESAAYRDAGGVSWQGRYTLPVAVGIPILAAVALATTERGRQLATPKLLVSIGALVSVAHIMAFAQNVRRYTVGYDGPLQFWKDAQWSPPLPSLFLTVAYAIVVIGFVGWLLGGAGKGQATPTQESAADRPVTGEQSVERLQPAR